MRLIVYFSFYLIVLRCGNVQGQTCCSGGAPLMTSFDIGTNGPDGSYLAIGLDYEYNSVNKLVDNNRRLENDPRHRSGQNLLLKIDYIHDAHWAFSGLLPMVIQQRTTFSESERASGIGDLTLLGQYSKPLGSDMSLRLSLGAKLPVGNRFRRDDRGIFLSPDMQPGTGTFDFVGRAAVLRQHFIIPNLTNLTAVSYRYNTTNPHFGDPQRQGGRRFKFGNEAILSTSFNYLFVLNAWFVLPDAGVRFRYASPNEEEGSRAPNSGGYWMLIPVGVQFQPNEGLMFRASVEFPVWEDLAGLQITTDLKVGVQIRYFLEPGTRDRDRSGID